MNTLFEGKCEDLISDTPYFVSPSKKTGDVLIRMEAYDVHQLAITDDGTKNGKLVGIVSRRDLVKRLSTNREELQKALGNTYNVIPTNLNNDSVRHNAHVLMYSDSIDLALDFFITKVVNTQQNRKSYVTGLTIVDKNFKVIGIIGYKDLLRRILSTKIDVLNNSIEFLSAMTIASNDPEKFTAVEENITYDNIYSIIRKTGYRTIPVVENSNLCKSGFTLKGMVFDLSVFSMLHDERILYDANSVKVNDSQIMTSREYLSEYYLKASNTLRDACEKFLQVPYYYVGLPVVEAQDCLVGITSYVDILKAISVSSK